MLQPKRTKFRKQFKGRIHGEAKGGSELTFGHYGLKATEPDRITARQVGAQHAHDAAADVDQHRGIAAVGEGVGALALQLA